MEEVWGEVDHTINYPHKSNSLPCREQIKALARATSTCSRLVDSIFASHNDYEEKKAVPANKNITPKAR
jgi:ppGpp synthetase/RelA/SpoT-type nucleotidyltranferase